MKTLRSILTLAAPVALAHLANMTMQLVDTLFVGRLGPEAIGGTSVGTSVYSCFMVLGIGLMIGMDYLVSLAFGAKKFEECHKVLVQALYVAVGVSIPFIALMYVLAGYFETLGVTHLVALQGGPYLRALSFSLFPLLLFTAIRQYLQAMGVAVPVMIILILGNVLNALGNWVFVFGNWGSPAFGVVGSGYATTLARTWMFIVLAIYLIWRDRRLNLGFSVTPRQISWPRVRSLVYLGLPAAAQMLLEVGVFAGSTIVVARLEPTQLAAHQLVLLIASCTFMIPLGLSSAAAVRVAQALGANNHTQARHAGWTGIAVGAAFMTCSGITLYIMAEPLLSAFTSNVEVIQIGRKLLLIAAFFQLFDGIQVTASGVLRGIGNTRASMIANLVGHWFIGLPIGLTLCFSNHTRLLASGIWIGLSTGLICVAVSLLLVWSKKSKEVLA